MSAILKAVLKGTGIKDQESGESRQDFIRRAFRAITDLEDAGWEALSDDAKKWYNDAADVVDANKQKDKAKAAPLPDFPGAEEDDAPKSRRRGADAPKAEPAVVKVGMTVTLITQKGREYVGEVLEKSKDEIVLKVKGEELEFDMDKVGSVEVFNDGKEAKPSAPKEPGVGDTVELTTKRGRTVTGEIIELTDDTIVLKTAEGEDDFARDRVETVKITGAGKVQAPAPAPAPASSRRGAAAPEPQGEDDEKKRVVNKGGVSVGRSIKEILADDPSATLEEVTAELTKRGIEHRDVTVKMNYREMQEFIGLLRTAKKLK